MAKRPSPRSSTTRFPPAVSAFRASRVWPTCEIGVAVDCLHDGGIRHCQHWLAKGGEARGQRGIAHPGPVLGIELIEVDGKALGQVPLAVDWLQRTAVRSVAATAERCPARSGERCTKDHWWPLVNPDFCSQKRQQRLGTR